MTTMLTLLDLVDTPEGPGYISRVEVTDPGGPNREAAEILAWNATVMTVAQVAEHLGLSVRTVEAYRRDGPLQPRFRGPGAWYRQTGWCRGWQPACARNPSPRCT